MTDKNLKNIDTNQENILKVGNVEVFMRAELGKTTISLKNAMEYDEGSIVMLDNLTQDPVDIYVDDILIAKGKIIAIEDTYGIKIVEIVENDNLKEKNNVSND